MVKMHYKQRKRLLRVPIRKHRAMHIVYILIFTIPFLLGLYTMISYDTKEDVDTNANKEWMSGRGNKIKTKQVPFGNQSQHNDETINRIQEGHIDAIARIPSQTGSLSNCIANNHEKENNKLFNHGNGNNNNNDTSSDNIYRGTIQVSCQTIHYRVPIQAFERMKSASIIVGVLSNASSEDGLRRRDAIRGTWASSSRSINDSDHSNVESGTNEGVVFFLVAGPWYEIEDEWKKNNDLIWIDEEEVYNGEKSVLTLKTYSFISIVDIMSTKMDLSYTHVFKTDDDSYVDLNALSLELKNESQSTRGGNTRSRNSHDYVGHCQLDFTKVTRDDSYKWPLTVNTYPEDYLPKYCQGAGYALSRDFVSCANSEYHIANVRFMPFEDVAVGILAERCSFDPSLPNSGEIKVTRYDSKEAKTRTQMNDRSTDNLVPITACMTGRIVQHRVIDTYDMEELHKTVLDPEYCKTTRRRRGAKIEELEANGVEWFG
jgi:hypothetical protein